MPNRVEKHLRLIFALYLYLSATRTEKIILLSKPSLFNFLIVINSTCMETDANTPK